MVKKKRATSAPVRLLYDYWTDKRHFAGTIIYLPLSEAQKMIGEGKARPAHPIPGVDHEDN